jgi:putative peptide zinc metalloprotease protein
MVPGDAQRSSGTTASECQYPVTQYLSTDRCLASPADSVLERPKMAAVEVAGPAPGREDVVIFCPARDRYIRVQGPQWAFLRSLDGRRTVAELERDASGRLPDGMVRPLLARFADVGLLEGSVEDGVQRGQRGNRRLRVTHLGAIQLSLLNPDQFLDRLIPLIRMLGGRGGRMLSALVAVVGLYSVAIHGDLTALGLERLAGPVWTATLVAALLLCVVFHELGHAAAVKYFGGRVRRMGLMLFYLAPAMFCDTSDAWRFPHKHQRAVVAAAGIWVQIVVAGLAGMALWLPVSAETAAWLWYFALFNIGLCVLNLIPFVQLDGYWMLVALTDVSNLRSRALGYLHMTLLRVITGVTQPQTPSPRHPFLTLIFGLGCLLFPPVLIATVFFHFQHVLLRLGRPGAAVWLLLAGTAVAAVLRQGLFRSVRAARDWPGRARWRAGLVGGAGILVVMGVLAVVRFPLTIHGRFEVSNLGEVIAVLPATAHGYLGAGDRTYLRVPSAADKTSVAEGVLAHELHSGDHELRYRVVLNRELNRDATPKVPRSATGPVSVRAAEVSPRAWFWTVYLQPVRSTLL